MLCLAWPSGASTAFRGEVKGHMIWPPRGDNGFGYDPMFVPDGYDQHLCRDGDRGEEDHVAPGAGLRRLRPRQDTAPMTVAAPAARAPGFGVYVHWPFCAAKCPYCDFNSHVRHQPPDQKRFAAAFAREIATLGQRAPGRTVNSIFLGGGTPSLMEPATVAAILDAVAAHWPLAPDVEVTMEANPSSVEAERFRGYRAAGVNRLSLGVQALNDSDLKFLGRLHDVTTALKAIEMARATFPRLSFDLIYARPGQTPSLWEAELGQALRLAADHLSLYQLTVEPGTPFFALAMRRASWPSPGRRCGG